MGSLSAFWERRRGLLTGLSIVLLAVAARLGLEAFMSTNFGKLVAASIEPARTTASAQGAAAEPIRSE